MVSTPAHDSLASASQFHPAAESCGRVRGDVPTPLQAGDELAGR